jgi:hypothetical protein
MSYIYANVRGKFNSSSGFTVRELIRTYSQTRNREARYTPSPGVLGEDDKTKYTGTGTSPYLHLHVHHDLS